MQTEKCIKTRTSVRDYKPDPVPDNIIDEILEAGNQAPSSGNIQNWKFIVVKKQETKDEISEACSGRMRIKTAPLVIVICSDQNLAFESYGARGMNLYAIQNTAAAIENMILAAWDKGIGSCWIGAFNEEIVKRALYIPTNIRPVAMLTLGYPEKIPEKPKRKDIKNITYYELYGKKI